MPIYEFECKSCHERFELLISISKVSEAKCPNCGAGDVTRVMSTFSAHSSGGSSHSHSGSCSSCSSGHCGSCGCH